MKETEFIGKLMPSHPNLIPIIQKVRDKYNLPEISPEDDPIKEIFLDEKEVSLEEFRQDIENFVRDDLSFFPPEVVDYYRKGKSFLDADQRPSQPRDIPIPEDIVYLIQVSMTMIRQMASPIIQLMDEQIKNIANIIYIYVLTGESDEVPAEWFARVGTFSLQGDPIIVAMANKLSDPEVIIQQFRNEYEKNFGRYRPNVTKTTVSTAYYMALKRKRKPWNYIVEEFIRLNHYSLPRDKTSKRYAEVWKMYSQRLKKRIQRSETILEVLAGDKE